ncbi:MAG: hypothetical protein V4491_09505 [Pseudomonadota bacterium]
MLSQEEVIGAIEEGQRLRGWIANGYAQVEYLLGDIIVRSHDMPEYEAMKERLPHRPEKRIAKVKQILEVDGYFAQHRDEVEWVIEAFESQQPTRHLLVHGFCSAHHTPDGDFGLQFRKWHRDGANDAEIQRTYRLIDLEYEKAQFTQVAERALSLARKIHDELGLIGQ